MSPLAIGKPASDRDSNPDTTCSQYGISFVDGLRDTQDEGTDVQTGEQIAIKLEYINDGHEALTNEGDIYSMLSGSIGIPEVKWLGMDGDFFVMIYALLGPSLEDLFVYCGEKFSLKTVLLLADQLICRMRRIHSKSLIHRDIKPGNFVMGSGRQGNVVYVIDFGLATEFSGNGTQQQEDGEEEEEEEEEEDGEFRRSLGGTSLYASLRNHSGRKQSWSDDMESLGYMLVHFARGSLPWQRLTAATDDELNEKIGRMKKGMSGRELCKGLPGEFARYIDYIRSLRFGVRPDYTRLRRNFQRLFVRMGFKYDQVFDWTHRLFDEYRERRSRVRSTRTIARSKRRSVR
ncbi:Casein kinase I isoform delta-A [Cytospora mali]|uniref:non-specific serine/threonine protein kinase n=1 Tax=Cytospora mali TaxID=578113 RepID=A0A194VQJ4_CYTMA|nr:Casein kinase I isoform delta-A [Valsa mali]